MSSKCSPVVGSSRMYSVSPGAAPAQLAGQLDALGLAAGERRRRLAELDVVEADVVQRLQHRRGSWGTLAKCSRASCTSISSTSLDALALEADLQRLAVEPPALADRAGHPDVGEEVHLEPVGAVALAGLAAAARLVEAEPARLVAADLRLRQLGEQRRESRRTP